MIIFGNRAHYSAVGGVENSIRSLLKVVADRQDQAVLVCREPILNEALDKSAIALPQEIELVMYVDEYRQNFLRRILYLRQGGKSLSQIYGRLFTEYPDSPVIARNHMHVLAAATAGFKNIRYLVPSLTVNQLREDLVGASILDRLKTIAHMLIDGWLQDGAFRAAELFVFSESMQRQVRQRLPKAAKGKNITMVLPGIDSARFKPVNSHDKIKLRRRLGLPIKQNLFLFVGRFAQSKGLSYLLEALVTMPLDCTLVLVGEGERESSIRETVSALGLNERVLFHIATSVPEDYYRACDCFVMSSTYEALGQTILEAAACGMQLSAFSREAGVDTATQELGLCDVIHYANELTGKSLGEAMIQSMSVIAKHKVDKSEQPVKRVYKWTTLLDRLTE